MSDPLRFNLGCGSSVDPAWVNLDASPNLLLRRAPWIRKALRRLGIIGEAAAKAAWDPCVKFHDLRRGIPCPDGAADAVYSSHFFEHIPRPMAEFLMREAFRALRPGGILRAAVPDLEHEAERYLAALRSDIPPEEKRAASGKLITDMVSRSKRHTHHWMYDRFTLPHLFETHGFRDVRVMVFHETRIAGGVSLVERCAPESLFVEGVRP
jgi:predicted SAM-dependent methyltransferase